MPMDAVASVKQAGAEMHRTIQDIEREAETARRRIAELQAEIEALQGGQVGLGRTGGQRAAGPAGLSPTFVAEQAEARRQQLAEAERQRQALDAELARRRQAQPPSEPAPARRRQAQPEDPLDLPTGDLPAGAVGGGRRGILGAIREGLEEAYVEGVREYIQHTAGTEPRGRFDRFRRRVVDRWLTDQGLDVEHFRAMARAEQGQMPGAEVPPQAGVRTDDGQRRDTDEATRTIDRHTQAVDRSRLATTAMGWSEQRLRAEWRQSSHELTGLTRQIGQLDRQIDGRAVLDETRQRVEAAREPLQAERARVEAHREMLGDEIRRRGGTIVGNQVLFEHQAGRSPLQQAAGAFLGGAGIGSGSVLGTLAGGAVGTLSPQLAVVTAAGIMAAQMVQMQTSAFSARVGALRHTLPTSALVGGDPDAAIAAAVRAARENKLYAVPEYLSAQRLLARTGSIAGMPLAADLATATGRDLQEVVGSQLAFAPLQTGKNPLIMGNLMSAFAQSGGGASPWLLPFFEQATMQAAQGLGSSFTRAPFEGVMGMVSAASRYPTPGVEPDMPSAMAIAGQRVQGWGQFMGGMAQRQDVLGDIAYYAVRQLGNDPTVRRQFQERYGLDLTDPLDIYRAGRLGPAMAAGGDRRIVDAIAERVEEAVPDRRWRGLMMLNATGDPEQSAYLRDLMATTNQLSRGAVVGGGGAAGAERLKQEAARLRGSDAAEAMFREAVEPDLAGLEAVGSASRGEGLREVLTQLGRVTYRLEQAFFGDERGLHAGIGGVIQVGMQELSRGVQATLESLLSAEVQQSSPNEARGESRAPGGAGGSW